MKKLRKVSTVKRKQDRKDVQERLKAQTSVFSKHPKDCCVCQKEFVRNNINVKTWQVTIREERVRLTCPDCWSIIQEGIERIQND